MKLLFQVATGQGLTYIMHEVEQVSSHSRAILQLLRCPRSSIEVGVARRCVTHTCLPRSRQGEGRHFVFGYFASFYVCAVWCVPPVPSLIARQAR